mmetsp:Transcript_55720/g.124483  ORF Transcript_55720/g.124483 Transcript_55720/m.124483 type:complete len:101 (+) Transcript_55720:788-1090(+)
MLRKGMNALARMYKQMACDQDDSDVRFTEWVWLAVALSSASLLEMMMMMMEVRCDATRVARVVSCCFAARQQLWSLCWIVAIGSRMCGCRMRACDVGFSV